MEALRNEVESLSHALEASERQIAALKKLNEKISKEKDDVDSSLKKVKMKSEEIQKELAVIEAEKATRKKKVK